MDDVIDSKQITASLLAGDTELCGLWLNRAGCDVELIRSYPRWDAAVDNNESEAAPILECMRSAVSGLSDDLDGLLLLGAYTWMSCWDAWLCTYSHNRLFETISALTSTLNEFESVGEVALAASVVVPMLECLEKEIQVEEALNSLCLQRLLITATEARDKAKIISSYVSGRPKRSDTADPFYLAEASDISRHFGALVNAIELSHQLRSGQNVDVKPVLDELIESEKSVRRGNENKPHRLALEALSNAVGDEKPWLHVDLGEAVYIFPFGVGIPPETIVEKVRELPSTIAMPGIGQTSVRKTFEVIDVWKAASHLERRFDGAVIALPPVMMSPPGLAENPQLSIPFTTVQIEVRLSILGNHYLRISSEIENLDVSQLQQITYLASEQCTTGEFRTEEGVLIANNMIELAEMLCGKLYDVLGLNRNTSTEMIIPGQPHVVLALFECSAATADGKRIGPVTRGSEIEQLHGSSLLYHHIPDGIAAIYEWTRFPSSASQVFSDVRHAGDIVIYNTNMTVLLLPGLPTYLVADYQSIAEVVSSLDGMESEWEFRLESIQNKVNELLNRTRYLQSLKQDDQPKELLEKIIKELQDMRLNLRGFDNEIQSTIALFYSPAITRSRTNHLFLEQLLNASGIQVRSDQLVNRLNSYLEDPIEQRAALVAQDLQKQEDERKEKNQLFTNVALAAIGVFGLTGAIGVIQAAGFDQWLEGLRIDENLGISPASENLFIAVISVFILTIMAILAAAKLIGDVGGFSKLKSRRKKKK